MRRLTSTTPCTALGSLPEHRPISLHLLHPRPDLSNPHPVPSCLAYSLLVFACPRVAVQKPRVDVPVHNVEGYASWGAGSSLAPILLFPFVYIDIMTYLASLRT
jgi:hypothetical protein